MSRTLLLLDIDGVVVPKKHPQVIPAGDEVSHRIAIPPRTPQNMTFRPAVIQAINRWSHSGADVRWLTSWGWRTKWLDQVGLPQLPVLYDPEPYEVFNWGRNQGQWKKPTVARFLATQNKVTRLVWADDDAFFFKAKQVQRDMLATQHRISRLLLVEPDCFVGLSDRDIDQIDSFLAK